MFTYKVKEVTKIVDGDTVDVIIDLGFGLTKKERVRVAGIDAPETRTRDLSEKALGLEAKEFIREKLDTDNIIIRTEKEGKYGRILGWLYTDEYSISINEIMVIKGYAWEYEGGSREKDYELLKELRQKDGSWSE